MELGCLYCRIRSLSSLKMWSHAPGTEFWGLLGSATGVPEFSGTLFWAITGITGSDFIYPGWWNTASGFPGHLWDVCWIFWNYSRIKLFLNYFFNSPLNGCLVLTAAFVWNVFSYASVCREDKTTGDCGAHSRLLGVLNYVGHVPANAAPEVRRCGICVTQWDSTWDDSGGEVSQRPGERWPRRWFGTMGTVRFRMSSAKAPH